LSGEANQPSDLAVDRNAKRGKKKSKKNEKAFECLTTPFYL
jgi:hypothetical protein